MNTKPSSRHRSAPRKTQCGVARSLIESLEPRRLLSVMLTYRDDTASTGVNPNEVQLTPANVKVGSFGKLFSTPLDGQVYAQPLVDTGVTITSGVNTSAGAAGVHDVVYVATENDTLYAIDAGSAGGKILWTRSFLNTSNPGSGSGVLGDQNNTLGASSIIAVPSSSVGSQDINPTIGITGTPVIDSATNLLYVAVKTQEVTASGTSVVQRIHAINLSDGTDAAAPYLIGAIRNGSAITTSIYVYGNGTGSVTDPYNGTGKKVYQFNALVEAQREALNLVNNTLYVAWASHGDVGSYDGMVVAWDVSHVTTSGLALKGVLNLSPNDGQNGVWGGGGRIAFEPDGSAFYFMTGNGGGEAPLLGSNGLPANGNYNEAVVKAVMDPTTSPANQNINGWGMKITDFFIPYNVTAMDAADSDFGSGSPLLLPDSAGIPGHPHLLIAGGKDGRLYVLDRDNLGGYNAVNDNVLNAVPNGSGHNTAPNLVAGTLSTPAYFNGKVYAVSGYGGRTYAFSVGSNGQLTATSQTSISSFGTTSGSPVVSASGVTNGIVWLYDRNTNELHAYDASSLATELWNSAKAPGQADALGTVVKFSSPTVVNGEVYAGTAAGLVVYGLTPAASSVSTPPVLTATALSGSSINLTWSDSSLPPNIASSYLVEESADGTTFTQITTAPAGSTSISIGGLSTLTKYYFRIRGFNGVGYSKYSNTANATTTSQAASSAINFPSGFAGAAGALALNGSAVISGTTLKLTDGNVKEAASAFASTPVDITNFSSQFTFQVTGGSGTADGFTFTLQGAGPTALGGAGNGLGYGGISNSLAIKFDLYNNAGEGSDSTGLYTNGAAPTGTTGSIDLTSSGVDLHSGHVFSVNLSYNGVNLSVTITDTQTQAAATQSYAVNIPALVGGSAAYAGFTAGTGGLSATQQILTWTYAPAATASPNAPSGLGGTPASATSITLNWTANAVNQTGYHLDRATDAGFTQNLITQTLPATGSFFTDSAPGLAPSDTFYYRIRAFNSAGDSGNSNPAAVTIPLAPPKPTAQSITAVSTSEIDIEWTDNAGHLADGYAILRAVNHGSFSQVETLPPTSRTPPSEYDWSDTNLTPGTFYEYHIEAVNVSGNNDFAGVNAATITLPPGGVTASPGNNLVNLSWTAPTGAVSYNIYRGTATGGESPTPIATGITSTSYTDNTAANGNNYFYYVTAVNQNQTLADESAPSSEVNATPAVITASLNGAQTAAASSYNLTALGTSDWAHWGTGNSAAAFDHKAGGNSQISNVTKLGAGAQYGSYFDTSRNVTWTDGTPHATDSGDDNYIWANTALGAGYSFTVPAGTSTQTLYVYAGGYSSGGTLTAHLSGGGTSDYVATASGNAIYSNLYTITFAAASAGQTLTISYVKSSNINGSSGSVDLIAAALVGAPIADTAPPTASVTSAPPLTTAGSMAYNFTVTYSDNVAVNAATLNNNDIVVSGSGYSQAATLVSSGLTNGPTIVATYSVPAPAGGWSNAANGSYTIALQANQVADTAGNFALAVTNLGGFTVNIPLPGAGSLSGVQSAPASSYNLTALGTSDWAHWGTNNVATAFDHKAAGNAQISNVTKLGSGANYGSYFDGSRSVSWTDGAPHATDSGDDNYIWANTALGAGYSFTVPAGTSPQTLYIYAGGYSSGGTLTAHLSGGGPADYVATASGNALYTNLYTITFAAASAGQTLTISYAKSSNINGTSGSVDLIAAALVGSPAPDTAVPTASLTSALPLTAAGSAPYTFTVSYSDNVAVNAATLGNNNLLVTGPGYSQTATLTSVGLTSGPTIVASYSVPAPAGGWTTSSSGTYYIALQANQVADTSGNFAPPAALGSFNVNISTAGSATLSGSQVTAAASYNLTTLGTSDWVHWGTGNGAGAFDHKAAGGSQISNVTPLGTGASYGSFFDPSRTVVWTDGTPDGGNAGDHAYIWANNAIGAGYSFTVPAGTTARTLYVYAGGYSSGATLTAHLSGGGAADYVATASGSGIYSNLYAITLQASSAGQTLTISYVKSSNINGASGSADLIAAYLTTASSSDTTRPQAVLQGTTPITAFDGVATLSVVYTDNALVRAASLGSGNLLLTGPMPATATFVSASSSADSASITATYSVSPPTGGWTIAANGTYSVSLAANSVSDSSGNFAAAASLGTFQVAIPDAGGPSLLVTLAQAQSSYNLTTLGASDWAHWGRGGQYTAFDHKAAGGSQISNVSTVGTGGSFIGSSDPSRSFSWTDGSPTSSDTAESGSISSNGALNAGFSFTVPAGTTARTLIVYAGGTNSTSLLTAHLSDGSTSDYHVSSGQAGLYNNAYTITYRAASPGQTLTITLVKTANLNGATNGSVDLMAAYLV